MKVVYGLESLVKSVGYKNLTIGNFDGLHFGHQEILREQVLDAAKHRGTSILLTFDPHPASVLIKSYKSQLIQTEEQFVKKLSALNIDILIIEDFTKEYSEYSAEYFFNRIFKAINFEKLYIGYDFKFGKSKEGDYDFLQSKSLQNNFIIEKVNSYQKNNKVVSSSLVRNLISSGTMAEVENFLGNKYFIEGLVVKGQGVGTQLGFPTVNISTKNDLFLKRGVYKTIIDVEGVTYSSVTNFGRAPTIKNMNHLILETHILNFSQNIYGKRIKLYFENYLRPEMKFKSVQDLKCQISKDILSVS